MILVTGSLGFDHIMDFPGTFEEHILPEKLKTLSVSFLVHTLNKNFGGNAGNIAYNLTLLGNDPIILSSAGKDFAPYKKWFLKNNITTAFINEVRSKYTGNFFVITDKNDCQIAGFYPGAMAQDLKLSIKKIQPKPEFAVISPTMPQAMTRFIRECKNLGISYLFNPAQQLVRLNKEQLMTGVDGAEILMINDYELEVLFRKTGLDRPRLKKMVKVIITTLGNKGSIIETVAGSTKVKAAKPSKVVDPTGAGDAYVAGFLTGYLKGYDLKVCGQMGGTAAVYAIEVYGTQNHKFTKSSFVKRYRQNFKDKLKL